MSCHSCVECYWGKGEQIHFGCYQGGKWRKWVPKRETTVPNSCSGFVMSTEVQDGVVARISKELRNQDETLAKVGSLDYISCAYNVINKLPEDMRIELHHRIEKGEA